MSKKLILIIISLFIIQLTIYWLSTNKEGEIITFLHMRDTKFQPKSGILDLSNQDLKQLPEGVLLYKEELESINLNNNLFEDFPYELLEMPNLRTINIENNNITILNLDFLTNKVPELQNLHLTANDIEVVRGLEKLKNLTTLSLSKNRLSTLPKLPKSLKKANFAYNSIQQLELDKLPNSLEQLNFSFNKTTSISSNKTTNELTLKELNMTWNSIDSIHISNKNIPESLEKLNLSNNPLTYCKVDLKALNWLDIATLNQTIPNLEFTQTIDTLFIDYIAYEQHFNHLSTFQYSALNVKSYTYGLPEILKINNNKLNVATIHLIEYEKESAVEKATEIPTN